MYKDGPQSVSGFLEHQSSDGELQDTGNFTLDAARARAKLGQFALPSPGTWVLKLVQAAVAAGAESIQFTFSRRKVKAEFRNASGWKAREILRILLSAAVPADRGLMHLQVALLAAAAEGVNQMVAWSCGEDTVLMLEEETVVKPNLHPDLVIVEATRPRKPSQKPSFWGSPVRYLFKQTAHEYKELTTKARCSPIPVVIDGYPVTRQYGVESLQLPLAPDYNSEASDGHKSLLALVPLYCFRERRPLAYPLDENVGDRVPKSMAEKKLFTPTSLPALGPVQGVLAIHSVFQRESRINYLLDGVIVTEERFENEKPWSTDPWLKLFIKALASGAGRLSLDIYLETEPERIDLSQFQTNETTPPFVLKTIIPQLLDTLLLIKENCHKPWKLRTSRFRAPRVRNASFGDILATGILSPFIPHMLVIGGAALVFSPVEKRVIRPYLDGRKAKTLSEDIDKVVEALEALA